MKSRRKVSKMRRKESTAAYLFIAPLFTGLGVFYVWAFIKNFYYSLTNKSSFGVPKFIGLKNYIKLLSDDKFYSALGHTLLYVVICVPIIVILATILAQLLNTAIKGKSVYRTILMLPAVTLPAAIGLVWKWVFNYQYGIINSILKSLNIVPVAWLSDPNFVILSVSVVVIWSSISYQMIILLGGLQGINKSYYEAASLDGASRVKQFFNITVPMLSPTIFFVTVITIINVFQVFDYIYLMIKPLSGGVAASRSLVTFFYEVSFQKFKMGYGAAISVMLFILILVITLIQMKVQKKWVHYE